MKDEQPSVGRRALGDFLRGSGPKPSGHGPETTEAEPGDESEEAADGCGRSSARGLFQGFVLELENGDREGVLYGAVLGRFRLNPSVGISFVFEAEDGMHRVEIRGHNLERLHRELVLGRRESVRLGDCVTGIEVTAWSPPGKTSAR